MKINNLNNIISVIKHFYSHYTANLCNAYVVKLFLCSLLVLVTSFIHLRPVSASELTVDKEDLLEINRIKSAYLFNFLKYIDFPESNESENGSGENTTYKVCVIGQDPFGIALDSVAGRKAKNRRVIVQRLELLEQSNDCHILFISRSESKSLDTIFSFLDGKSILTVSDIDNFAGKGGMVAFTEEEQKIGLEINLKKVQQTQIKISALLLEIANIKE